MFAQGSHKAINKDRSKVFDEKIISIQLFFCDVLGYEDEGQI